MTHDYFKNNLGVVTLCGSTKFFTECMEANRQLTFDGWIVLMCGSWGHSYHKDIENINTDYAKVKKLHFLKINFSDVIVIVSDKTKYFGDSTKAEVLFAQRKLLPIFTFDSETFESYSELPYYNNGDSLGHYRAQVDNYEREHPGELGF